MPTWTAGSSTAQWVLEKGGKNAAESSGSRDSLESKWGIGTADHRRAQQERRRDGGTRMTGPAEKAV